MSKNGIVLPDVNCPKSNHGSHHYIELGFGTEIFRCKHCEVVRWYPNYLQVADVFTELIRKIGLTLAYEKEVRKRPSVMKHIQLVAKVKDKL